MSFAARVCSGSLPLARVLSTPRGRVILSGKLAAAGARTDTACTHTLKFGLSRHGLSELAAQSSASEHLAIAAPPFASSEHPGPAISFEPLGFAPFRAKVAASSASPSCRLPASLCRLCSVDSWILAPIRLASIVPGLSPGHGVSSSISRGEPQEATCVLTTLEVVADHNHVCVCIALISQDGESRAGCAQSPPDSSIWQPDYSWQVTLGSTICRCFN